MTDDERVDRIRCIAVDQLVKRGAGIAICITLDDEGRPTYSAAYPTGTVLDLCDMLEAVRANIIEKIPPHSTDGVVVRSSSTIN